MPIEPPNLDDLRYAELRDLLMSRIPVVAPEWTDHNDSDPGVALIQLFAWLGDQLGYRLNQVPERSYVHFLKLIGVTLRPAEAATTRLALVLGKPELVPGRFAVPATASVDATVGAKPSFELDEELDAVPAQLGAVLTTTSQDLRSLTEGTGEPSSADDPETWLQDHFSVLWDGKTPKLEELPGQPLRVGQMDNDPEHSALWLGFVFNPAPTAGFLGQRVTLTVQLDDDEQPDVLARALCGEGLAAEQGLAATYDWYRPKQPGETGGSWRSLRLISDSTQAWSRSGELRFDVPAAMGPIPDEEWQAVRAPPLLTLTEICAQANAGGGDEPLPEPIAHPLPGALKLSVSGLPLSVPISGWLRVRFPDGRVPQRDLRMVSFNVVGATHARTITNERVGRGDGTPGQRMQLAHGDVLDGSLELAVEDRGQGLLMDWQRVDDLDAVGPEDRVFTLDRESGELVFGDGLRGRPVDKDARVIALRYRHGGGASAELPPATITKASGMPAAVSAATNIVSSQGGRDAETLDDAKQRAPRELKVLRRAVTPDDFRFLAAQTPGVRVARAEVVALRRPFAEPEREGPGLDLDAEAPGALSVVVVPELGGPPPRPTEGQLREVCRWLDAHRLVTTEVHVVPPMYLRLYDLDVTVTAQPGYSAALLRSNIAEALGAWLHPLTGGDEGEGFPFGGLLQHSELVAQLMRVEGVRRVERAQVSFSSLGAAEDDETPEPLGRLEREAAGLLTACPDPKDPRQVDRLLLLEDELPFLDASALILEVLT